MGSIDSGEPKSHYTTTERDPQDLGRTANQCTILLFLLLLICVGRASCLREPDVSDCSRRCIIISFNTSAAPSQWLLGLERHAPPRTHISLSTEHCHGTLLDLTCRAVMHVLHVLHCKLLRGLWGCGDGSLVVVIAVPAGRCAV